MPGLKIIEIIGGLLSKLLPAWLMFFAGKSSGKKSAEIVQLKAKDKDHEKEHAASEFARLDAPDDFDGVIDILHRTRPKNDS